MWLEIFKMLGDRVPECLGVLQRITIAVGMLGFIVIVASVAIERLRRPAMVDTY
jgi:hypothetical protein